MLKLRQQIEAHIQEIVFFFSLVIAFSTFLSGTLYLALGSENLTYVIGSFGAAMDHGLFSFLGYGFFYLSVMTLHMGYVTNYHVFNFRDLKREYPVLLYSLLAHVIVLVLFSNLLSVIQLSLEISRTALLTNGSGGLVGHLLSGAMYSSVGIYGSVISLIALMGVTALLGSFFEIPDVVVAIKSASNITKKTTVIGLKTMNTSLINSIQFLAKTNDMMPEATVTATGTGHNFNKNWINTSWNKANTLVTDHLHIYKKEEKKDVNHEKDSKIENKKVIKKDVKKNEVQVNLREIAAKIEKKSAKPEVIKTAPVDKTVTKTVAKKKTVTKPEVKTKAKKK